MRKARAFLVLCLLAPMLSGCLVVGTAAAVTDVTVGVAGAAIGAAGTAVDVIIPGDKDDGNDDRDR